MKNPLSFRRIGCSFGKRAVLGLIGATGLLFATEKVSAQTTNAFDRADDAAYLNAPPPNGLAPGGQNGGFGFGAWTFTVNGNGGAFTAGSGANSSWDLWNMGANTSTVAIRPFNTPLTPGQSFSVDLQLNSLDNSSTTNALVLQDANGNTLFSYWHVGWEPNGAVNGSYSDATTSNGSAVGFSYNYQHFSTFTFTLNSPTTYTFTDNTFGKSFTGVLSGAPITKVAFVRGNGATAPGNGQDFQFNNLKVVSSAPPTFQQQTPAANSLSVAVTSPVSVQAVPGGTPLNVNNITLKVDGNAVTPNIATSSGVTTISCQPGSPFSPGSVHTVMVVVADNNNGLFTNTWTFTTGFSELPATIPGPLATSNGNDIVIFSRDGNGWIGSNYDANSSRTIYARVSMTFHDMAGETGTGGAYGGLHFFQDANERLLLGNSWLLTSWSVDAASLGATPGQIEILPSTPIVLNEWHTMVAKIEFAPGGNAAVKVWLDPDFTQTENNQLNMPLQFAADCSFDNIRLRCGNGTANAEFTNIVVAALGTDVGFKAPAEPQFQSFVPGRDVTSAAVGSPISVGILVGGSSISTNRIAMSLDGTAVTPVFSKSGNIITVTYQPPAAFAPNSFHTVDVSLTDGNNSYFSTSWSFTVDPYPSLPVTYATDGPVFVANGIDMTIFPSVNEWIDGNYGTNSSKTLYVRFTMAFTSLNGEPENGGSSCYGGLHFFQGNNEKLLIGETWMRTTWSVDTKQGGQAGEPELLPSTTVVPGEWHTMLARIDYVPGQNSNVKVWLDPDFSKSEYDQTNPPLVVSVNNTFDNVRLRCGNGNATAGFKDIMFAAAPAGVGLPVPAVRPVLSIHKLADGNLEVSWTGGGTLQQVSTLTGTWSDSANQANPQTVSAANSALFFRVKQ